MYSFIGIQTWIESTIEIDEDCPVCPESALTYDHTEYVMKWQDKREAKLLGCFAYLFIR